MQFKVWFRIRDLLGAQESVHDWVQAMDVFVLPSLYEGLERYF